MQPGGQGGASVSEGAPHNVLYHVLRECIPGWGHYCGESVLLCCGWLQARCSTHCNPAVHMSQGQILSIWGGLEWGGWGEFLCGG